MSTTTPSGARGCPPCPPTAPPRRLEDEQREFKEILEQFKRGIEQNLEILYSSTKSTPKNAA
jgi:hypothetical protein